jgi:hypothetical protein
MADNGYWGHSSTSTSPPDSPARVGQGENLAVYGTTGSGTRHAGYSAKAWYDEIVDYDYSDPVTSFNSNAFMVGHFT